MPNRLITAPAVEPVTLAEARLHLRVIDTSEDTLITSLIVAAREYCENFTGRKLIQQTWDLILDAFPADGVSLTYAPTMTIDSVTYLDTNGSSQVLSSALYVTDTFGAPGWLVPVTVWPGT